MLLEADLVLPAETLPQFSGVVPHGIEDAALAIDPALLHAAEETVEEARGKHFGRQGPVAAGPAHVALNAFAEGFLRDTDLQGAEAGVAAGLGCDHLVERHAAGAASGELGAGHQRAHRAVVIVAGTGQAGRRVVDPGDHVHIVAEGGQRSQAWAEGVAGTGLLGNPKTLHDAVAVEPEDEPCFGGLGGRRIYGLRGIGGAAAVEHGFERRQADPHREPAERKTLEQRAARDSIRFVHKQHPVGIPSTSLRRS